MSDVEIVFDERKASCISMAINGAEKGWSSKAIVGSIAEVKG